MEELTTARARIYLAQGADDDAVDPASSDVLDAHLRAKGKELVYDCVAGANHSFRIKDKPGVYGWRKQMERITNWFLLP